MKLYRLAAALGAMFLFALLASPALAGDVVYLKVFDDSLTVNQADSTAVINVSKFDYISLVCVATRSDGGAADTATVVYLSAMEVLPKYAISQTGAQYDSTSYQSVAATVADTSTVAWLPNLAVRQTDAASAVADTIAYNSLDGSSTLPGSAEIRVRFNPLADAANRIYHPRAISVPLVNTLGVPFSARYAYFKFRMPSADGISKACNLRVVLKGVRY